MIKKITVSIALLSLFFCFCELCVSDYGGEEALKKDLLIECCDMNFQLRNRFRIKSPSSPIIKHYEISIQKSDFEKFNNALQFRHGKLNWQDGKLISDTLAYYGLETGSNIWIELTLNKRLHSLLVYYCRTGNLHVLIINH